MLIHATCVALAGRGVLILGKPGSGKSSLALQLIDQPGFGGGSELMRAELVADDQVVIRREGAMLVASAPAAIAGLLEIRGLGIVRLVHRSDVAVAACIRLAAAAGIDRMPEPAAEVILGVALPAFAIDPSLPSAAARVRAALVLRPAPETGLHR